MSAKNFVIFYVDKPEASAAFYSALLNRPPVESSPTFALFALDSGLMLGLWSRHTVEPAAAGRGNLAAFQPRGKFLQAQRGIRGKPDRPFRKQFLHVT